MKRHARSHELRQENPAGGKTIRKDTRPRVIPMLSNVDGGVFNKGLSLLKNCNETSSGVAVTVVQPIPFTE